MQSETAIRMVELLGGSPVPMGSDEVYTSLQSNLINGSENNEFVLYTAGHGGVAKYYSYDEHTRVPDIIIMNDAIKERLTAEQQQAIEEAAKESTIFEIEAFAQAIEEEKEWQRKNMASSSMKWTIRHFVKQSHRCMTNSKIIRIFRRFTE